MGRNLFVTIADQKYLKPAKQLFSSVYFNAGWRGDYLLLAHNIKDHDLLWFKKRGIVVKKCQVTKVILPFPAVYLSVGELFKEFFRKWKTIIFIEGDTTVRASLDRLLSVRGFAAIKDSYSVKLEHQFFNAEEITNGTKRVTLRTNQYVNKKTSLNALNELKQNYDLSALSFNAGVMVFNSEIINKDTYKSLSNLTNCYKEISFYGMQGIFNLLFYKNWTPLPQVYNVYAYLTHQDTRYSLPLDKIIGIVIHYAGSVSYKKPWNSFNYLYKEWLNNLKKADNINLKKRLKPLRSWSYIEILFGEVYYGSDFFRKIQIGINNYILKIKGKIIKVKHGKAWKSFK